jgi:hypothetical protein
VSIKLKYFVFDFDDNILHMDTSLHMEKKVRGKWQKVKISPEKFVYLKDHPNYRPEDNDWDKCFIEFSDEGERKEQAFINDIKKALKRKNFGPSFDDFIECIIEGRIFAIITARSHKSKTIRKGIEYIIDNVLSDQQIKEMKANIKKFREHFRKRRTNNLIRSYLDNCEFIGVSSPNFEILLHQHDINVIDTPSAKMLAFRMFVKKVRSFSKRDIRIGFSDDDHKNIKSIKKVVKALQDEYPKIDFNVFHAYEGEKKDVT